MNGKAGDGNPRLFSIERKALLMRTLALFLLACVLTPAVYARDLPKDGNDLLEYCSVMVDAADNPSNFQSLIGERLTEKVGQGNWCAGFLQGTEDVYQQNLVYLGIFAVEGLTFDGPEKTKQRALDTLRGPCFGDAPLLQLGRVLVKWLREHPERLHEPKSLLTTEAFKASFPCEQTPQKEVVKPTPPAPK
jgi:hypothetical protein